MLLFYARFIIADHKIIVNKKCRCRLRHSSSCVYFPAFRHFL